MSQSPPPFTPGQPMQPHMPAPVPQTNGWAIASLICGIIGCIPFLTSLLAILFGILGIKKSSQPMTGGKGLAIAGLVLGILGVLGWGIFGGGIYALFSASAKPRAAAKVFVQDLVAGNVDAAMTKCVPAVKREDVQAASDMLRQTGTFQQVNMLGFEANNNNGVTLWEMAGAVTFDKGTKPCHITLQAQGEDYKVVKFQFE